MKTFSIIFLFALTLAVSAQEKDLVGTWSITECKYVSGGEIQQVMADEIKAGTAMTDYIFKDDGTYKLISNMSGSGATDTVEGNWKLVDNQLVTTLTLNGKSMEIALKCERKDNMLSLSRTSPDGSLTITNTYRRK